MDKLSENIRGINTNDDLHNREVSSLGWDDHDEVEIRPIRKRDAIEAGLDYWIDEGDLERERQRRMAVKNRKVRVPIS